MPVTAKVPLGANTLNRKWCIDIDTSITETPSWVGVFGVQEFKPTQDATTQDSSDFDSEGWKSETVTAQAWGGEGKVQRKSTVADPEDYDPGQELLRLASIEMGEANVVKVRIYEDNGDDGPKVEAYSGRCGVKWSPDGGGMEDLDTATFTLLGQGKRTAITHPGAA